MEPGTYRSRAVASIKASQAEVFAYLDDQTRLAAHMEKRSLMMLGGRMDYDFDAAQGRAVGSVIRMSGRFLGLTLLVCEVVTERVPPIRKRWETRGPQRLLVINSYVMGFETRPSGSATEIAVAIDYRLPRHPIWRWAGRLLAPLYARWCVSRMVGDARRHFNAFHEPGLPA